MASLCCCAVPYYSLTLTKSSKASAANCFPRLPNIDIVYILFSLPRHTALTLFGKDSITTSYLMLNIHSIKTAISIVVYLTFDNYDMTAMMICSRHNESPPVN